MKQVLWIFLAMYTSVVVVACGKGGSDTAATPTPQVGCPAGTVFQNGYCYNQYGQVVNTGSAAFKADNFRDRSMSISNSGVYKRFVKEMMAVCDRDGYNAGTSSCDSFTSGYAMLTLQNTNPASNTVRLTVEVSPSVQSWGWYNVSVPTGTQLATCGLGTLLGWGCFMMPTTGQMSFGSPVKALDMVISAINNSQGFEARSYGSVNTVSQTKLIQLQVDNGKLQDGFFDFRLIYDGQAGGTILSGRMLRCADASCGFAYPY